MKAEIQDKIDAAGTELVTRVLNGESENYLEYLRFISRFHTYSPYNQLLIHSQKVDATHVAGYQTWAKLGFQVSKGQKGIQILAPIIVREKDNERKVVGFRLVSVFDAGQLTEPEKVPSFFYNLGGSDELYNKLVSALTAANIPVAEESKLGSIEGYADGSKVVVKAERSGTNKFLILLHELSHHILHFDEYKDVDLATKELHAEATAFVVASHFGIDSPFSGDYILSHGNSAEDLLTHFKVVGTVARKIIALIGE